MKSIAKLWITCGFGLLAAVAIAQHYSLTNLTVGSNFSGTLGYGINQLGQVTGVGFAQGTGEDHAFIYSGGAMQDLGDFGYPFGADGDYINNAGQLSATGYGPGYNALIYSNGVATPIGSIDGGFTVGLGMNNLGDIVGRGINGDGNGQGFSYIGGQFSAMSVDLARGINDSDEIVGSITYFYHSGDGNVGVEHAFTDINGSITDIGNLGGGPDLPTEAYSINNLGQVTGYSSAAGGAIHAFLYSNGSMTDLGTFPPYYTYGVSINASGQVLGNVETAYGGQIGMFLYSNGVLNDFSTLLDSSGAGWSQLVARQINDKGYVVGYGTYNGGTHGFIARPFDIDLPTSYSIYRGSYVSGDLSSLFTIDGNYLVIKRGVTLTAGEAPVSIVLNGTATNNPVTDLRLSLTAHANVSALAQKIEMYDYSAGAWVTVANRAVTTSDSTQVGVGSNPGRFVQPGTNAVSARVSWTQTGPTPFGGWSVWMDQIVWNDSP